MKYLLLPIILFICSFDLYATWTPVNSNIQDDLSCVYFKNNVGLITGKKGVYISNDGGISSSSWVRIENYLTVNDSIIYNQSQFYGCVSNSNGSLFYFCGQDTILNKAVIFSLNPVNSIINIVYIGNNNSALNKITYSATNNAIYAVGKAGLLVSKIGTNNFQEVPTNFTYDFNSVAVRFATIIICAENHLIKSSIGSSLNFIDSYYSNRNFKDYEFSQNSGDYTAISDIYSRETNNVYSEPHNYHSNLLNGNDLFFYGANTFIGTESGIFKTYGTTNVIEYQPSSNNHSINSISNNSSTIFAVGKNGTVLYSNSNGGMTIPYAEISSSGGCLNTQFFISSIKGTVNSCIWSVDNVYSGNTCSGINYNATILGTHSIKLIYSNGTYTDTAYSTFNIVPIPSISLPYTISDTILCHSETIEVNIENSEENVSYSLYNLSLNTLYSDNSVLGNGSDVTLTSNQINLSNSFYIKASSTLANCKANFTSVIPIIVEQTNANFHVGLINSEPNEPTPFYQKCTEADHFLWSFSNQPNINSSNLENPTINFNQIGQTDVQLIAWSNNGCYDSIVKPGPYIYNLPPNIDSNFNMTLNDLEYVWDGYYNPNVSFLEKTNDGDFIISGIADTTYFHSKYGTGLQTNYCGLYVAKYTKHGVLKWILKSNHYSNSDDWQHKITDLKEDLNNKIYLTGTLGIASYSSIYYFEDNRGDSIPLSHSYLMKFDENGCAIWERQLTIFQYSTFENVNFDNSNNPYVTITHNINLFGNIPEIVMYSNQVPIDTIVQSNVPVDVFLNRCYVLKFDETGNYLDNFLVQTDADSPRIKFDGSNNMIVYGHTGVGGQIEVPSTGQIIDLPYTQSYLGAHFFITKFDSNGNFLWKNYGYTDYSINGLYEIRGCSINDLEIDGSNNIYITGLNDYTVNMPMTFINSDNSVTTFHGGKYYISKINPNGICSWINGNKTSFYGAGFDLIVDDNEIQSLVYIQDNPYYLTITNTFTSEDDAVIETENYGAGIFIITYDFQGNLTSILESGTDVNQSPTPFIDEINKFEKLSDNYYVWISNFYSQYNNNYNFQYFGENISDTLINQNDNYFGLVSLFTSNNGINHQPYYVQVKHDTICDDSYQFEDGTIVSVLDSMYHESTLTAINGYDSLIRTTVYKFEIDSIELIILGDSILTNFNANSYQWVNCTNGYSEIIGETNNYYEPSITGDYALIVSLNNCIDTSECISYINYLNLPELNEDNSISIYPNPTNSIVKIQTNSSINNWTVFLKSNEGKLIEKSIINSNSYYLPDNLPNGLYFLYFTTPESIVYSFKVTKNN